MTEGDFEQFSPHVGMLRGATNIGLIDAGNCLCVIDTGAGAAAGAEILEAAEKLYPGKKVGVILNTHSHADHCGGNHIIREATGAAVWAPYKESRIMEHPELMAYLYWGGEPFPELRTQSFVAGHPCTADRVLAPNETVALPMVRISCIPLPGHCFDQLGFLVQDEADGSKAFFVGDALFGMSMLKRYWIPFMLNERQFRESVQRIESTDARVFVPGHGGACTAETIHALAEMNQLVTLEAETLIMKLLKKAPLTHEELLEAVAGYAGIDMKLSQFILIGCTLRSYLACLHEGGLVSFRMEDNRMLWHLPGSA